MTRLLNAVLLSVALLLGLSACDTTKNWFSDDVEGYEELDETLAPVDKANKGVFDAAASWIPVQVVLEQIVFNPSTPQVLKDAIKTSSREVTNALNDYRSIVALGGDDFTTQLTVFMNALARAQAIMVEAYGAGLVEQGAMLEFERSMEELAANEWPLGGGLWAIFQPVPGGVNAHVAYGPSLAAVPQTPVEVRPIDGDIGWTERSGVDGGSAI